MPVELDEVERRIMQLEIEAEALRKGPVVLYFFPAAYSDGCSIEAHEFAEAMGTGLQMLDDLGSLACPDRRDKGREDLRAARPTWPWAWLAGDPQWDDLISLSRDPARLDELADRLSSATLERGRACIRTTLDRALADLRASCPDPIIDHIASELARMETSYG